MHNNTNRAIAREIGCSPSTVANELRRGTPPRKSNKGRKPGYSARRGEAAYKANRKRSRKPHRICHCTRFIRWIMEQVKEHKWSLDACVGYARLHRLFSAEEMVCTHTLYNEVWAGSLDLSVTELPEAMKRKQHKDSKPREPKKSFGTDISQRPEIAALRIEEEHWEGDTVVGKRAGKEAVVLSLLEKKTENYIAIRIPGKDADSVLKAMQSLREEFGDKFSQVFKTITVDNGYDVAVVDDLETGFIDAVHPKARFYKGDLRDKAFIDSVFNKERVDAVIHFAANSQVGESMVKPLKYYDNNIGGTRTMLQSMIEHGIKHIVFSATAWALR